MVKLIICYKFDMVEEELRSLISAVLLIEFLSLF
jgi:hypothetical protein